MTMRKTATSLIFAAAYLSGIGVAATAQAQMMPATHSSPADRISSSDPMTPMTQMVSNGPQTSAGDQSAPRAAELNVIDSRRYDRMVETNRGFRATRMREECGPITDPQLHQSCVASFQ